MNCGWVGIGVLVARDPRVGRGGHLERGDDRGLENLQAEIIDEVPARLAVARRERPAELAVELVADQVGDARGAALDDDPVDVGRHRGLGQGAVVERGRVGGRIVADLRAGEAVQVDRRVPVAGAALPLDEEIGQGDRGRVHGLGELDRHDPRQNRGAGDLGGRRRR